MEDFELTAFWRHCFSCKLPSTCMQFLTVCYHLFHCVFTWSFKLNQTQTSGSVREPLIIFSYFPDSVIWISKTQTLYEFLEMNEPDKAVMGPMMVSDMSTSSKTNSPTWTSRLLEEEISLITCPSARLPVWILHRVSHSTWGPSQTSMIDLLVNFSLRTNTTTPINLFTATFSPLQHRGKLNWV